MQLRDVGIGLALPGVPHGECGTRGRQAVPLHLAQLDHRVDVGARLVPALPVGMADVRAPTGGAPTLPGSAAMRGIDSSSASFHKLTEMQNQITEITALRHVKLRDGSRKGAAVMPNVLIHKASELKAETRVALEAELGRSLQDDEEVSIMTFVPHAAPTGEARTEAGRKLQDHFHRIDQKMKGAPEKEAEEALD